MRKATRKDVGLVTEIYVQAVAHAKAVGHIDWPDPISSEWIEQLIDSDELYCFGDAQINGVAKISHLPDPRVWEDDDRYALYLSKLATSQSVRGTGYVTNHLVPEVRDAFGADPAMRLDCLADNTRLRNFYESIGFRWLGDATFYSTRQAKELTVSRYEARFG